MDNTCEQSGQIKLISECYVKHIHKVEAATKPHYLNPVDLVFLPYDQMQRGSLFSTKPKNMQSFLEKLKKSLSITLVDFYPLAGQLTTVKFNCENASGVYMDCNKGPGAKIIHAAVEEVAVRDILAPVDVPMIVRSFFDLGVETSNYDGHHNPLLSIQVTELSDGLFVGFTMNHSLGDGTSLWHFISSISEIFDQLIKNENVRDDIVISRKPVFNPFLLKGYGPILKMPHYIEECESIARQNTKIKLRERIFHFSSKAISSLKAKANEENDFHNTISSFKALSAFIWRSITRARNLCPQLETSCTLVMNARQRINPPLSNDHFGNFLMRGRSMCKVDELLSNGFGWAAMLIHQVVESQDDEKICDFYERMLRFLCKGSYFPFYSPNLVVIGGSTRFDMYGPEFGLGKAEAVLVGYSNKQDGKVTASPGCKGDGSVDIEICLKPETMNALELDNEFMSFVRITAVATF